MQKKECHGKHERVVKDEFARLCGVTRRMEGDCYCLDCKQPIPAFWNGGKTRPAIPQGQADSATP